jgi:DNA-binding MarR family transcriptional regulator
MMKKGCKHEDPGADIGYLIWQITKIWQRGRQRMLEEFGLTSSQLEILGATYHLSQEHNEVTQIILSQETSIDPMTTSTILRNLEKKGLILRRESKTDTRARVIELTEDGFQLFERAISKVKKAQCLVYDKIDKEALRTQLKILLETINRIKKDI